MTSTPEDEPPTASDELDEEWVPYQWPLSFAPVRRRAEPPVSAWEWPTGVFSPGVKRKIDFDSRPVLVRRGKQQPRANPAPPEQAAKRAKHLPPLHSGCIAPGTYIL